MCEIMTPSDKFELLGGAFDGQRLAASPVRIPLVTDRDKWLRGFAVCGAAGGGGLLTAFCRA